MQILLKHKAFIFFISIAIAMTMAPAGACDALSAKAGEKPCHNRTAEKKVIITAPDAGDCQMASCPTKQGRIFVLPESSFRRLPNESRSSVLLPAIAASPQRVSAAGLFQAGRFVWEKPLSFQPPPLFCLFCVYIC